MAGFRDAVGRFRGRQAQAAEAAETIEADELAAVEELAELEDDPAPQSPADLHRRLAELRAQRADLLRDGAVDRVVDLDAEIARCMVGLEAAQAKIDADYDAAPAREYARQREAWARLAPKLEAARARRDAAALEIWHAIDDCAAVEVEAEGIANMLG